MTSRNLDNLQCHCMGREVPAKICSTDTQESATGLLMLSVDGLKGYFQPDSESNLRRVLDASTSQEVFADVASPLAHIHGLVNFRSTEYLPAGKRASWQFETSESP